MQLPKARLLLPVLLILPLYFLTQFNSPPHPTERTRSNLIYWKPHKTGSSSTKIFLTNLANAANLTQHITQPSAAYRFSKPTSLYEQTLSLDCAIHAGHIRTAPYMERRHEGEAGVVITTTRDVRHYLVSRFFHLCRQDNDFSVDAFQKTGSLLSLRWWNFFMAYDPCETMRYYDGMTSCDVDETVLRKRAERIADRLDCVIDTNDAQPDADAICEMMDVNECPTFGATNTHGGVDGYDEIMELEHIRLAVERVERPGIVLREALLKRRCRLLGGRKTLGRMREPVWPKPGCGGD